MKVATILLVFAGLAVAKDQFKEYDYLYADSTVNSELHSALFPIPKKYGFLESHILSNEELEDLAEEEIGKVEIFLLSGESKVGKAPDISAAGIMLDGSTVAFSDIDYVKYAERKSFGGFLTTVGGVALITGAIFGTMELYNLILRDEYDYKNVLVYSGSLTVTAAVFYFPFSTDKRIGFKLK